MTQPALADTPIGLLHVDDHCIVVDKPAGWLSLPGRGVDKADCVAARVRAEYPDALVVHRLDMATSGVLLFARGIAAQRALSRAFAERATHKRYAAIVHGVLAGDAGEIDLPLAADWPNRPKQRVDAERGRASLTRWRVLACEAGRTRLELEPVTGRAHQLRVHLAAVGHAIVGDTLYAPSAVDAPRLMLHATRLRFAHPASGATIDLTSAAPF